jgi:hypothetical protein
VSLWDVVEQRKQFWVFDRPLASDPLMWLVGVFAVAAAAYSLSDGAGFAALYIGVSAGFALAIAAGTVREYTRGRRARSR